MAEQLSDPMLAYINPDDADVPLSCFRYTIKQRLAMYLNQGVAVLTDDNLCPDWGGLADLIGFDGLEIDDISRDRSPGNEVIQRWIGKVELNPTVGRLVSYLATLDRIDILTDLMPAIQNEIHFHRNRHEHFQRMENPIQDETVSSAEMERQYNHILTIDDTMTTVAIYDAFVCYEFKDIRFVRGMIARLEDPSSYGFKLFVPGRNNLIGTNSFELMTRIISERCRHMIVVLSNNFIRSEVCSFQSSYAFSLNPGARDKKMVPIKIEDCPIPETLRIMACCDFTNSDLLDWSWDRLAGSIMRPMPNREFIGPQIWRRNRHPRQPEGGFSSVASTSSSEAATVATSSSIPSSSTRISGRTPADSAYISDFRHVPESASSSSRQDANALGESSESDSQDSLSNVKSNAPRTFIKRLTNFATSPNSKKKGKMKTTKF